MNDLLWVELQNKRGKPLSEKHPVKFNLVASGGGVELRNESLTFDETSKGSASHFALYTRRFDFTPWRRDLLTVPRRLSWATRVSCATGALRITLGDCP